MVAAAASVADDDGSALLAFTAAASVLKGAVIVPVLVWGDCTVYGDGKWQQPIEAGAGSNLRGMMEVLACCEKQRTRPSYPIDPENGFQRKSECTVPLFVSEPVLGSTYRFG
jgi:hypothetical protein